MGREEKGFWKNLGEENSMIIIYLNLKSVLNIKKEGVVEGNYGVAMV